MTHAVYYSILLHDYFASVGYVWKHLDQLIRIKFKMRFLNDSSSVVFGLNKELKHFATVWIWSSNLKLRIVVAAACRLGRLTAKYDDEECWKQPNRKHI